jgi:hypothetical protein
MMSQQHIETRLDDLIVEIRKSRRPDDFTLTRSPIRREAEITTAHASIFQFERQEREAQLQIVIDSTTIAPPSARDVCHRAGVAARHAGERPENEDSGHKISTFLRCLKNIHTVKDLWLAYTSGNVPSLGLCLGHDSWQDMEKTFKETGLRRGRRRRARLDEPCSMAAYRTWRSGEGKYLFFNRKDLIQLVKGEICRGKTQEQAIADAQATVTSQWHGSIYQYNTHLKGLNKLKPGATAAAAFEVTA